MNSEKHGQLRTRAKAFALRVIRMSQALPRSREANVLLQQVLRSATGMAANYRAAGRSRTKAEFIAKIGVVVEEADETLFWLEMLTDKRSGSPGESPESDVGSDAAPRNIHCIAQHRQRETRLIFEQFSDSGDSVAIPRDSGDLFTSALPS